MEKGERGLTSTATLTYALTTSGTTSLGLEGRIIFMKDTKARLASLFLQVEQRLDVRRKALVFYDLSVSPCVH